VDLSSPLVDISNLVLGVDLGVQRQQRPVGHNFANAIIIGGPYGNACCHTRLPKNCLLLRHSTGWSFLGPFSTWKPLRIRLRKKGTTGFSALLLTPVGDRAWTRFLQPILCTNTSKNDESGRLMARLGAALLTCEQE